MRQQQQKRCNIRDEKKKRVINLSRYIVNQVFNAVRGGRYMILTICMVKIQLGWNG